MKFQEFSSLYDLLEAFPTEQSCIDYLEIIRWKGSVRSPFKELSKVYKCKNNRYKCSATNKYFNVRTNSIFEHTNIPLRKWMMAIYIFTSHKKGISSIQLAKDLSISQKSAWFLLHRLRYAMGQQGFFDFVMDKDKVIEIDETYVGGKEKNKHRDPEPNPLILRVNDKATVFGIIERGGKAIMKHVPNARKETLAPLIETSIRPGTVVMSDEWHAYGELYKTYPHHTIKHMMKEYVRGEVHTNTIESLWSHVKWCITGSYKWTSRKHLQAYLEEIGFRYNSRKSSEYGRMNSFLGKSCKGSLPYKVLVGKPAIN